MRLWEQHICPLGMLCTLPVICSLVEILQIMNSHSLLIVCQSETLYLPEQKFHPTNVLENDTVSTPAFKLGDIVDA
ncbi:DUF1392 family protein [Nostoc sp. CALU 546]|uniref:DUF1392 family protein n=1 Tax=Nostoc sp. CALU 546 TaxID=1867241 RepID=UPI003B679C15